MSITDTYRIFYHFTLVSNNSVGNEWNKEITANGRRTIHLKITVVEDDTYPDIGRGDLTLSLQDDATASTEITVRENKGRYQGNLAVWKVTCTATAI